MPASISSVVVFPQPDGPSTATNAPSSIARSIRSTAVAPAHCLRTFRSSMRAIASPPDAADRHLRQVPLAEHVEQKTRQHIENRHRGDDPVVDTHDVVRDPEQIQAHYPVLVLDQ